MSTSDQLRREIDDKRSELSADVNALTDKVTPSKVMGRQVDRARTTVSDVKGKVMGTVDHAAHSVHDSAVDASASLDGSAVKDRAQGNPLAAGLIAFGAGMLLASLLPASPAERQAGAALRDKVQDNADILKAPLTDAAHEAAEHLREPAEHAAQALKLAAGEAASTVKEQAGTAVGDLTDEAKDSKDKITST